MVKALAFLLALALVVPAGAQRPAASAPDQPEVTFRVEVNYVEVDAIVTDADGTFVTDLTRDDFELLEDNRPEAISTFSLVNLPVPVAGAPDPPAAEAAEPDVASNERAFEGRLYLIVLDDLHTNPLRSQNVRRAAREFLRRAFAPGDLAAVVHTSGRLEASQELTGSRRLLLASIDRFNGRKIQSLTLDRIEEYNRRREIEDRLVNPNRIDSVRDPSEAERSRDARSLLETLRNLSEWMTDIRGRRKSIVYFGEGIDYDIHNVFEARDANAILTDTQRAIGAAQRANVNMYMVDARGVGGIGDELAQISETPDDFSLGVSQVGLSSDLALSQDSLRSLADNTGGLAAVNRNDLLPAFDRIARANSSYYLLGYYPTNARRDGRFRNLQVRVKRPGLTVVARKGYVAPSGTRDRRPSVAGEGASPELRSALESPLPSTGLTMRAISLPFKGAAPRSSVALGVEVGGSRLRFAEQGGLFENRFELSMVLVDHQGRVQGTDLRQVQIRIRPDVQKAVATSAVRFMTRLEVPPGRYQARFGVRESVGGLMGTVYQDVEIPDFSREPLSMSGVALTSTRAALVLTARPDKDLEALLNGPPSAGRTFTPDDALGVFVEVYDNVTSPPHQVEIVSSILDADGRTVLSSREERHTSELGGSRGGFEHAVDFSLAQLRPGRYVLRVEARSGLDRERGVTRDVPFTVVSRIEP
jgi:VWFA-related protein